MTCPTALANSRKLREIGRLSVLPHHPAVVISTVVAPKKMDLETHGLSCTLWCHFQLNWHMKQCAISPFNIWTKVLTTSKPSSCGEWCKDMRAWQNTEHVCGGWCSDCVVPSKPLLNCLAFWGGNKGRGELLSFALTKGHKDGRTEADRSF